MTLRLWFILIMALLVATIWTMITGPAWACGLATGVLGFTIGYSFAYVGV